MSDQNPGGISLEALKSAAESGTAALREKEQALAALRAEVERDRAELDLVLQLIRVRESGTRGTMASANGVRAGQAKDNRAEVLDLVAQVLDQRGTPLGIGELMDALGDDRRLLPGQQSQANLISVIRADDRFVRTERGVYGLASWGLEPYVPPSKATGPTRHRRAIN